MITIDTRTNVIALETFYQELAKGKQDILLTKKLSKNEFGLVPQIIQFIASWFLQNDGKLIIDIEVSEDLASLDITSDSFLELALRYVKDFYDLEYFYPVVVYCWSRDIEDRNGKSLKRLLRRVNELTNEKMHRQEAGRGPTSVLVNVDHVQQSKGLLSSFYRGDEFIDDEFSFDFALERPFKKLLLQNTSLAKASIVKRRQELIEAIYELMKNTHEWGRTNMANGLLKQSVRGLYLDYHYLTIAQFHQKNADFPGLVKYFSSTNFQPDSEGRLAFIEISVFDTGVGFASRYSGKRLADIPTDQQVAIVKQCLMVHKTSASGVNKIKKGKGLDRILRILNRRGVFLLRTGNTFLFRNLLSSQYSSAEILGPENIDLFDRVSDSNHQFTDFGKAIGSVVTLIYPLNELVNA